LRIADKTALRLTVIVNSNCSENGRVIDVRLSDSRLINVVNARIFIFISVGLLSIKGWKQLGR